MSKKYEKLWEALIPDRHDLLYKDAPLDTSELATLVGYRAQKEYLEEELNWTPHEIVQKSAYLNRKLSGKYKKDTPKDIRIVGFKYNDNWYRTLIPVNGRKEGLKRYLDRFDQKEKIETIERASSWAEDRQFKESTTRIRNHNIFAEVGAFFRQKINGKKIRFKQLVYDTKEKLIEGSQ